MVAGQAGFWDVERRLRELSEHGDPLEKLGATVDLEMFRAISRLRCGHVIVPGAVGPASIPV